MYLNVFHSLWQEPVICTKGINLAQWEKSSVTLEGCVGSCLFDLAQIVMNRPASQPNPLTWVWNAFPKTLECFSDWKREGGGVGLMLSSRRTRSREVGRRERASPFSLVLICGSVSASQHCDCEPWQMGLCVFYTHFTQYPLINSYGAKFLFCICIPRQQKY